MLSSASSDSLSTSFNFLMKDAFLVTWCLWFSAIIFVPFRSVTVYGVDSNLVVNLSFRFLCFRITQSPTFSSDGLACLFLFAYSLHLLLDLALFSLAFLCLFITLSFGFNIGKTPLTGRLKRSCAGGMLVEQCGVVR